MKNIYCIDYENTCKDVVTQLIERTPKDSWYYVFYSEATPSPEYVLTQLPDRPVILKFINCHTGSHDAMDFQIVAMVTRMSAFHPNAFYHIISRDQGFRAAVQYLQNEGVRIVRDDPPGPITAQSTSESRTEYKKKYRACVDRALYEMNRPHKEHEKLCSLLSYRTNTKEIHQMVQKLYADKPTKLISPVYQAIKRELHKEGIL